MNKIRSSSLAKVSLALAIASLLIIVTSVIYDLNTGTVSDSAGILSQLGSQDTLKRLGIFATIVSASVFAIGPALLGFVFGAFSFKATRRKDRGSSAVALTAIIFSLTSISFIMVSIVMYASTIKQLSENIVG